MDIEMIVNKCYVNVYLRVNLCSKLAKFQHLMEMVSDDCEHWVRAYLIISNFINFPLILGSLRNENRSLVFRPK